MATIAELQVAFSADTKKLQDGIKKAGETVQNSGKQLETAFGAKGTQAIGSTTNAVINFNRVIQDAPYGLIGVANNIDPLVQSFQGLKASTGSAMGAIRLLLKSAFTGPGAMITVVSLATSGLLLLQRRMRGTGDAANQAKPDVDTFNKALEQQVELLLKVQNLKGPEGQLQIAKEQLKAYDGILADLKEQLRLQKEQNTREEVDNTNAISQNRLRGSRAILVGLQATNDTKDLEAQIESIVSRREELTKNIESLERLIGTQTYKNLTTQKESVLTIEDYNKALIKAKSNIEGAGTAIRDNLLLEGLGLEPQEPLVPLVDIIKEIDAQTKNAFGNTLPTNIKETKKISDAFTVSFSQGLADVIMQSKRLNDALRDIGMTLLRSGLAKILEAALFGGGATTAGGILGSIFPKLFTPSASAVSAQVVVPTLTGANMQVGGQFVLKGTDLVATINKTNSTSLR